MWQIKCMSIITKIENRINSFGRGSIFYPDDFLDLGTSDAIRQSLTRLCKDEKDCQGGLRNLLLSSNWWRTWSWYYYAYLGWNSQKSGKKRPRKDCPDRLLRTACSWFIYTDSIELCIYDWWFSKTFGVITMEER